MKVSLKWITEDAESTVVHIARVSNPKAQAQGHNPAKLIQYLVSHGHWSPLQMASACFEIVTTRDIARQMLRHDFDFQEFSQRYEDVRSLGEWCSRECRLQDKANRQNSFETADAELASWWLAAQSEVMKSVDEYYRSALKKGIAKEVARALLPEGLTPSRLYMSGSMRSWFHYCVLRTMEGTQKEHRAIALAILEELRLHCPVIFSAQAINREQERWKAIQREEASRTRKKLNKHPNLVSVTWSLLRYCRAHAAQRCKSLWRRLVDMVLPLS